MHVVPVDHPLTILDYRGSTEAELLLSIVPTVYKDPDHGEAVDTDDEEEGDLQLDNFVGKTMRVAISLKGVRGLSQTNTEGVYVTFRWVTDIQETTVCSP